MINRDDAIVSRKFPHQMTPRETPRRIPVNHQQNGPAAFIDVVQRRTFRFEPVRFERVFVCKTGTVCGKRAKLFRNIVCRKQTWRAGRIRHDRFFQSMPEIFANAICNA